MIVLIYEFENHSKLNTLLFRSKRNKAKENKNRYIYEHMATFANINLGHVYFS
jgi:hypothetical protein